LRYYEPGLDGGRRPLHFNKGLLIRQGATVAAINNSGEITGFYVDATGSHARL
jgi:hypothetical protein